MMRRIVTLVVIAVLVTLFIRAYVIEGIYVASASMEPTLPEGAKLFLEKVTVRVLPVKRGDIVVFTSPVNEAKDLIKRIIALPGDTVEIREKGVFLNGQRLSEPYVKHTRQGELLEGDTISPVTIPPGHVFVMGDNRDESGDSRDWKDATTGEWIAFIPIKKIKGKILLPY